MMTSNDFHIKEATVADVEEFLKIAGDSLSTFRYFNKRDISIIENHLVTVVLIEGAKKIGYGHLDPEGNDIWLGICVAEAYTGRGLGGPIMKHLLEKARAEDISEVTLSVDKSNHSAIQFYKKFNFKTLTEREELIFMSLSL